MSESEKSAEIGKQIWDGMMEGFKIPSYFTPEIMEKIKEQLDRGERVYVIMPRENGKTEFKKAINQYIKSLNLNGSASVELRDQALAEEFMRKAATDYKSIITEVFGEYTKE